MKDLRGNIETRLAKLDAEDSPFDAIILAAAGLNRNHISHRISQLLDSQNGGMLGAVGQGAIGIENGSDNEAVKSQLVKINHLPTFLATTAERSLLRYLEGGCSAPLGVETKWTDANVLEMKAIVVSTDGKEYAEVKESTVVKTVADADAFGIEAAKIILTRGADKILAEIKAKRPTTVTDLEEK